ncbi:MAG: hypothetical protein A2Y62_13220 [Candidatus Fischerbacteria bacterium RBG_13_37_8]|uniref:Transposase InsH N-terminal domain-containing protein n=1 Tax=Candidatus Fischerbacteria bacterium RBG_13_37_8 TaxID=1817863 RepID=A0A1F5VN89_9BACT|nr:MAG: hypothetical protein A2Y62_13220 [Candidatus Fischerbacteria bacterium RBG_13_37_8]
MSARYYAYNLEQSYFAVIAPKLLREKNLLLFLIDYLIERQISMVPFEQIAKNKIAGAPGIHPKILLKILSYSFINGIYSCREIERRLTWDQNYIAMSGNRKISHTTLSKFITTYKEAIEEAFTKLFYVLIKIFHLDLMLIAEKTPKQFPGGVSNFSLDAMEFNEEKDKIKQHIEQILKKTTIKPFKTKRSARTKTELMHLRKQLNKIDAFFKELEEYEAGKEIGLFSYK